MCKLFTRSIVATMLALGVTMGLFVVGAPSASLAAPLKKTECDDKDLYPTVFDKLKCRHDAVADQLDYTADTAFGENSKLGQRIEPSRLGHIKDSKSKGQRARVKNTKNRFKKLAKDDARANRDAGHLVPLTAADDFDGDGICDYEQGDKSADCAAIEVDEFGDLQKCNPEKKNKGKGKDGLECDRFYDTQEATTDEEADDMDATALQMDETYSAVEDDFIEMNKHLDTVNANLPEGALPVFAAANGCIFPTLTPGLSEAKAALRGLTAAAWGAASIMDSATGQTVVFFGSGGNGRAAAVIVDAAALTAELAYITVEEIANAESAELQAATMNCVIKVAGDIAALQAQMALEHANIMANDDKNTATIMTKVEEVRAEVVRLLNTPQGQREEFPAK
ncbi:MAG: hypothetical protein OEU09_11410 [Rhodospirillales bacterium]|nr:hypothetical protein [Rhodospirillales bacterium]